MISIWGIATGSSVQMPDLLVQYVYPKQASQISYYGSLQLGYLGKEVAEDFVWIKVLISL